MATATPTTPVSEVPILPEGQIPVANIQPAERDFPDSEWINVPNVPVFAEHQTVTAKGRKLTFGRDELAAVARNCNRRIRETGDYAALVVGHTLDPEVAPSAPQKPVVGLAGPFRIGLIQQPGRQPRWAILCDWHIQRRHANVLQDYPRRSPELWVEDGYDQMYLDPIALLGAEAPRLDMGLMYSAFRRNDGREVERYSAAAPAAGTVFVPCEAEPRKHYSAESTETRESSTTPTPDEARKDAMAFSPEDIKQLIDALDQQDWVQWVKDQMKASTSTPEEKPDEQPAEDTTPVEPEAPAEPEAPVPPTPVPPTPVPPVAPVPPAPEGGVPPVKYSRMASELDQMRHKVAAMEAQLAEERGKRVDVERYTALAERRRTRLFDIDSEFDRCKYSKMNDQAFNAHLDLIDQNYREIPLDQAVPTFDMPAAMTPSRPGGKAEQLKYSKEASDRALSIAKQKLASGEKVTFEGILEDVLSGKL
jgi:hypothetical protein